MAFIALMYFLYDEKKDLYLFFFFKIWASSFMPNEPKLKDTNQKDYFAKYGRPMLMDYVNRELEKKVRLLTFWAEMARQICYVNCDFSLLKVFTHRRVHKYLVTEQSITSPTYLTCVTFFFYCYYYFNKIMTIICQ